MDIWDFALTEKEMETIASLNEYTSTDPEDSPW
jgi:diketogulonate reductase-like aldo/keto reductase